MTRFPKGYADRVAKLRVAAGFVLVVAFLWFSKPTTTSLMFGLPVSVTGLLLRAWASGHLEKNLRLAATGPFTFVRNPLYLGTVLVAAGLVIASREWWLGVLFAAVFLLVYLPVIELEEEHLRKLFPAYEEYAERVPMLVPRWRKSRGNRRFRWSLYRKNEEYNALLGYLCGVGILLWKALH